jgi:hypothetical protein
MKTEKCTSLLTSYPTWPVWCWLKPAKLYYYKVIFSFKICTSNAIVEIPYDFIRLYIKESFIKSEDEVQV